jgi:hypothetical protein
MKQRIPLTPHNIQVLKEDFGFTDQELTLDYWIKQIVSDEQLFLETIKIKFPWNKTIEERLKSRAGKMRKKAIRDRIGLPNTSGSLARQRQYAKILKKSRLIV